MEIDSIAPVLKKASGWVIIWSAVVFVCGILTMVLPLTFAFAIAFVIGGGLLIGAVAHVVFGFQTRDLGGFALHMLLAALYGLAAISLLANPLLGLLSLALILAIVLLLEGILELALYFRLRHSRHSVWLLADGIGTLILGIVVVAQWPPTPEVMGTLIGLSLMLSATSRAILSLAIRALGPDDQLQRH